MTDNHGWKTITEGLPDGSLEITGYFDTGSYVVPDDTPWRLFLPRRVRFRRWEIVEYRRDGGPITKHVHPRRFWLSRSAARYAHKIGRGSP